MLLFWCCPRLQFRDPFFIKGLAPLFPAWCFLLSGELYSLLSPQLRVVNSLYMRRGTAISSAHSGSRLLSGGEDYLSGSSDFQLRITLKWGCCFSNTYESLKTPWKTKAIVLLYPTSYGFTVCAVHQQYFEGSLHIRNNCMWRITTERVCIISQQKCQDHAGKA